MRRLPAELLSEIFLYLAESDLRGYQSAKQGKMYAAHLIATTVACVCAWWRAVALGTPRLWSRITVVEWTRHVDAYVGACIALSRERELDIKCSAATHLPVVLAHILPHARRWASISLCGSFDDFCAIPPLYHFVRLVSADLVIDSEVEREVGAFEFLADAPLLRQARIHAPSVQAHHTVILPSSWKLTFLQLDLDDVYRARPLLAIIAQYSATLETLACTFDDKTWAAPSDETLEPISLPALRTLELTGHSFIFLAYLTAPNTRSITVADTDIQDAEPYTCLFTFLTRHSALAPLPNLHRLRISEEPYHSFTKDASRALLRCLALTESLQELAIEFPAGSSLVLANPDAEWTRTSKLCVLWKGLTVHEGKRPTGRARF
ncbi:hypothetical protein BD626DRAFT_513870 [Schizophyllum amplum]|uniref:F-box domain-containing protein n=1 Tax=Schizophyllum amplum TaxID=97359 RepID=A0A550BYZ3_9AGAR|nr:hypothetical protein BD626DRAFT_513870 [Auriculariopsis ampla]